MLQSPSAKCQFTCSSIWVTYLCPPNDLSICLVLRAMEYLHARYRLHWFAINRAYDTAEGRESGKFLLYQRYKLNREHCRGEVCHRSKSSASGTPKPNRIAAGYCHNCSALQFELLLHSNLPHQLNRAQTKTSLRREVPEQRLVSVCQNQWSCIPLLVVPMMLGLNLHNDEWWLLNACTHHNSS